jgi:septal ring factor EnvC (AmiA/AmiB activator)
MFNKSKDKKDMYFLSKLYLQILCTTFLTCIVLVSLIVVMLLTNYHLYSPIDARAQQDVVSINEIEKNKNQIEKELNSANAKFTSINNRQKTLREELNARKKDIQELEEKIKVTDLLISKIKEQENALKQQVEKLFIEQGLILRQVQVEDRVPFFDLKSIYNIIY